MKELERIEDNLIDDLDPQEKLKADLSGVADPDTRALILLRNTLQMATDIMNDAQLPFEVHNEALSVLADIESALNNNREKASVLKDSSEKISLWLKEEDLDDIGQEFRAIKKIIDRAPSLSTFENAPKTKPGIGYTK